MREVGDQRAVDRIICAHRRTVDECARADRGVGVRNRKGNRVGVLHGKVHNYVGAGGRNIGRAAGNRANRDKIITRRHKLRVVRQGERPSADVVGGHAGLIPEIVIEKIRGDGIRDIKSDRHIPALHARPVQRERIFDQKIQVIGDSRVWGNRCAGPAGLLG